MFSWVYGFGLELKRLMDSGFGHVGFAAEETEVASFVGLSHLVEIE
jgi:hypothetical protein